MFSHILVPLDGSPLAEAALPAAAFLAQRLTARVTLMHVVEKNAPRAVHGQPHLTDAREAATYLEGVAAREFPAGVSVERHVHTTEVENVAESIVAHMAELGHDLVIMCSHGKGRALHLFLGSIAQKVIALGSCPVLITHPDEAGGAPPFACRNILIPLDGVSEHAAGLPVAGALGQACGAELHLAMVIPHFSSLSGGMRAAGRMLPGTTSRILELATQEAGEYLQGEIAELHGADVVAHSYVLRGDPADVIVDAADRARIDLIVLATHGKSGMDAFWAGSVTHRICSRSRVPLLLVKAAGSD